MPVATRRRVAPSARVSPASSPSSSPERNSGGRAVYRRWPKPPYTYLGLIATAILSEASGRAPLSSIYQFFRRCFPFFCSDYKGWMDSVRHMLSNKPCFQKVLKDPQNEAGKSNFWAVDVDQVDEAFLKRRNNDMTYASFIHEHLGLPSICELSAMSEEERQAAVQNFQTQYNSGPSKTTLHQTQRQRTPRRRSCCCNSPDSCGKSSKNEGKSSKERSQVKSVGKKAKTEGNQGGKRVRDGDKGTSLRKKVRMNVIDVQVTAPQPDEVCVIDLGQIAFDSSRANYDSESQISQNMDDVALSRTDHEDVQQVSAESGWGEDEKSTVFASSASSLQDQAVLNLQSLSTVPASAPMEPLPTSTASHSTTLPPSGCPVTELYPGMLFSLAASSSTSLPPRVGYEAVLPATEPVYISIPEDLQFLPEEEISDEPALLIAKPEPTSQHVSSYVQLFGTNFEHLQAASNQATDLDLLANVAIALSNQL